MKKMKWVVIVLLVSLISACDRKQEPLIENYGIKDYSIIDSNVVYANESYYTKENGQLIDVYGYNGQLYFSYDQNESHVSNDLKYIYLYTNGIVNKVYNLQGELLLEGKINIVYSEDNECYIVKDSSLLNENHEVIFTSKDLINDENVTYMLYKDHLFSFGLNKNKMIDIKTKNEIEYTEYLIHGDYIILTINNKFHLYNLTNNQHIDTYDSIEFGEYYSNELNYENHPNIILIKGNEKKYLISNKLNDKYEYTLDNDYVLDFSVCSMGAQLKDKNGNVIISDCLNDYRIEGKMIGGYMGFSGDAKVYLDLKEFSSDKYLYHFVDNYLVAEDETTYINYDFNGNVMGDYSLSKLPQGYIGYKNQQYYFLDEELKPISKGYQNISCSFNNYCILQDETGYQALAYNLEVISPFEYTNGFISDRYIELDNISQKIILRLEKGNNNFKFPEIEQPYLDIQVDELINQYQLDKNMVNKDLDFFKKYAYIVENNDKLGVYKSYVFDILQVVLDNKDCLNEGYFLQRLKTLDIQKDVNISNAGEYYFGSNKILLNDESKSTIYHELMHFLEFSMDDDFYPQLWKYQGNIITQKEYSELSIEERNKCEYVYIGEYNVNLLTEGGAELMSAKYFTKGIVAYTEATAFLTGIEHIIGSDMFNDLFFSNESDYLMMKLFLDSGYTFDQYCEIYDKFFDRALDLSQNFELRIQAVDVLIDLYKANVSSDWFSDSGFVYILKVLGGIGYNDYSSSKYGDLLEGILFKDFIAYEEYEDKLLEGIEIEVNRIPIPVLIIDNELYLGCSAYYFEDEKMINGYASFYYDFISGKMIDYHFIKE